MTSFFVRYERTLWLYFPRNKVSKSGRLFFPFYPRTLTLALNRRKRSLLSLSCLKILEMSLGRLLLVWHFLKSFTLLDFPLFLPAEERMIRIASAPVGPEDSASMVDDGHLFRGLTEMREHPDKTRQNTQKKPVESTGFCTLY